MREKKNLFLIEKIQKIRSKNNKNWMDILRLAFIHDEKNAAKIMSQIYKDDKSISALVKKLVKNVKKKIDPSSLQKYLQIIMVALTLQKN